jgi:NAD-dependent deacetylase
MLLEQNYEIASELLANSRRAVALTGAGVSTPSGIPDFRSPDSGIWRNVDPFQVATIYAFRQRPQDFYDWVHPIAKLAFEAEPNIAHTALADLEIHGPLVGVITQNIDMLHSKAGSKSIYEVHGHWREATCLNCYTIYPSEEHLIPFLDCGEIPYCEDCGGVLKPNIILFGEQLPIGIMNEAKRLILSCDLLLVAGSSLETAPAGDLPMLAVENGAKVMIINLEPTYLDSLADVVINANVVDALPRLSMPFVNV